MAADRPWSCRVLTWEELSLKTKLAGLARSFWLLLTAVPGWPDAPKIVRLGRALPVAFPFAIMLILVGWKAAVRDPHLQSMRAQNRPLLLLESQIATLRLNCSEQEAHDLAGRAAELSHSLIAGPKQLAEVSNALQKLTAEQHWESDFHAIEGGTGAPVEGTQVAFLRLKGKLTPTPDNAQPFSTLVMLLDGLSREDPRIDLTGLAIRADEQGRYSVETHFRLAYRVSHEKAAQ
jgi:hypothetical protein